MMIDATIVEKQNTSNKTNLSEGRRHDRRNEDPKSLGTWDKGETIDDDHDEMNNLCFMALG